MPAVCQALGLQRAQPRSCLLVTPALLGTGVDQSLFKVVWGPRRGWRWQVGAPKETSPGEQVHVGPGGWFPMSGKGTVEETLRGRR